MTTAEIGVFGGSGFYAFLDDIETVELDTPYGVPSSPITIGSVAGRRVAFLPRHGRRHELAPHAIPYRANVWAMKELGVAALLAPGAVGSLQPHVHPGDFVVVDQLVDRTWGRADTFHTDFSDGVVHVSFAQPFDAALRRVLLDAGRAAGVAMHDGGTVVVIQGPRFSTAAESRWFRDMGWTVVIMTAYPEAVLAAEAGLAYASLALVTDYDAGVERAEAVTMETVFRVLAENIERVKGVILRAIPAVPPEAGCGCGEGAMDAGMNLT
jgi:5'-methylthioadenosine phosphorylase